MTDPFIGQGTIFPLLDPDLFAETADYNEHRLAANRRKVFDIEGLAYAVDAYRLSLSLSWQRVAEDSGVSVSTLHNIRPRPGRSKRRRQATINALTLMKLCLWMGINDFRRFLKDGPDSV